jgi:hypothetical protein
VRKLRTTEHSPETRGHHRGPDADTLAGGDGHDEAETMASTGAIAPARSTKCERRDAFRVAAETKKTLEFFAQRMASGA